MFPQRLLTSGRFSFHLYNPAKRKKRNHKMKKIFLFTYIIPWGWKNGTSEAKIFLLSLIYSGKVSKSVEKNILHLYKQEWVLKCKSIHKKFFSLLVYSGRGTQIWSGFFVIFQRNTAGLQIKYRRGLFHNVAMMLSSCISVLLFH